MSVVLANLTDLVAFGVLVLIVVTLLTVLALDRAANRIRVIKAKKQAKKAHNHMWRPM